MILAQGSLQFGQIWYNWPKLKTLRGNTGAGLLTEGTYGSQTLY